MLDPEPEVSAGLSQESLGTAVQLQPVGEFKLIVPEPAALPTVALPLPTLYEHVIPDCVTLNDEPFTLTEPTRAWELGFAATVIPNVDGFDMPPPNETVIHGTSEVADFKQFVGFPEAEKVRLSPAAFAVAELGVKIMELQV